MAELETSDHNPPLALARLHKQLGNLEASAHYAEDARKLLPPDDDYNLGNIETSLEALRRAAAKDDFNPDWARNDPDLQWVRGDPRFEEILQSAASRAGA